MELGKDDQRPDLECEVLNGDIDEPEHAGDLARDAGVVDRFRFIDNNEQNRVDAFADVDLVECEKVLEIEPRYGQVLSEAWIFVVCLVELLSVDGGYQWGNLDAIRFEY